MILAKISTSPCSQRKLSC